MIKKKKNQGSFDKHDDAPENKLAVGRTPVYPIRFAAEAAQESLRR